MPLSIQDWHNRYLIQAQWTRALRLYFFDLLKTNQIENILDIGCGTGALLPDLQLITPGEIFGADILIDHLLQARITSPESYLAGANVHQLPFPDQTFDMVLSHYFLMWVGNPEKALDEMMRVVKPDGHIVAFAEPDYGGRIDFPPEFIKLRDYQITGLLNAGADPRMGRKLKGLFSKAGLLEFHCGVYEGSWDKKLSDEEIGSEWQVLEEDLAEILSQTELQVLKKLDLTAWQNGSRLIYVPTFYAWGQVKLS